MAKAAKSTRNFAKKHLDAALKQRKKLKPMKNALRRKAAAFKPQPEEQQEAVTPAIKWRAGTEPERGEINDSKRHRSEISQHKEQLETLKERDPEFYEFLKEHDKELLEFDDEDEEDEEEPEEPEEPELTEENEDESFSKDDKSQSTLSTSLVDEWCVAVREKQHVGAVRNLLQAFRTACHYGDGEGDDLGSKYSISSSHVFNKIMVFVLCEMDGTFRLMLGLSGSTENDKGQRLNTADLEKAKKWKKVQPFVKTYLGNSLHILNQMTDNDMIAFTLRRLKASVPFLGSFPKLAQKFLKVALHFWGSGDGALPVISLLFIREMAVRLGEDVLDAILKGVYKEYAANSKFVNAASLPRIQFRASCVVELYGIDPSASYRLAFGFIRQIAIILRNAITMKTKDVLKSVYCWQYINSLHLWVKVVCKYPGKDELRPLLYPLVQIIGGVAHLVPTVRYFPLRLQCARMLNEMAAATRSFMPVVALLVDMLQFKELYMAPTGGVGKAVDFDTTLKAPKLVFKTKAFQEGCVASVLVELCEHLAQWSYAVTFPELAVIPLMQLRQILKKTNIEWFRRQLKQTVEQVERNAQFVLSKRATVNFSPKDTAAVAGFLLTEQEAKSSPLSQYVIVLRQRAEQRRGYIHKKSEVVGDSKVSGRRRGGGDEDDDDDDGDSDSDEEGDEEEAAKVFSKDWLPEKKSEVERQEDRSAVKNVKNDKKIVDSDGEEDEGDVIEDLLLSSDDDEGSADLDPEQVSDDEAEELKPVKVKQKVKSTQKSTRKPKLTDRKKGKRSGVEPKKKRKV